LSKLSYEFAVAALARSKRVITKSEGFCGCEDAP
tara:strand:+ start:843 stop:944 length:102 start_codon:yes stop_codon:yes gene_type:complete